MIYIVQNIFHQGRETRNISLNVHYIVLFKSPRDKQQVSILARQVNPGHVQEFMKSYEEATSRPHGYLMLDLKPTTDDKQRLKSNVLPGENNVFQHTLNKYIQKQSLSTTSHPQCYVQLGSTDEANCTSTAPDTR